MKIGFVCAICRSELPWETCHSGRIGFVCAFLDPGSLADYEGFVKNSFVCGVFVGWDPEAFSTTGVMMLEWIYDAATAWTWYGRAQLMKLLAADRCVGRLGWTMHGVGIVLREVGVYSRKCFPY
jgi:hypothetical protein